jgi:uncharacterized RDD family membrane protein YckC
MPTLAASRPGSFEGRENLSVDPSLGIPLAPWWKRLAAIAIDGSILSGGWLILLVVLGGIDRANGAHSTTSTQPVSATRTLVGLAVLFGVASVVNAVYFGIMNGSPKGQTVGKMALRIAVRDGRSGQGIGRWRALGRALIASLFYVVLVVPYVLDNLAPLWTKRRQAWHDSVIGSVVVDLSP